MSNIVILVNPILSADEAVSSMDPLIAYGNQLKSEGVEGASVVVTTFPTFGSFFNAFTSDHVSVVGSHLAEASRLIRKDNFATAANRTALVKGLLDADAATPGLIVLLTAPTSYQAVEGTTSVTEAWRSSVYHITVVSSWDYNATYSEKRGNY
ncbi:hypothetical protein H0H87_000220 [Tephrocybe sp. NHM501043]|nr:hypothetical protein H0H87_000220 [Tephrocybe sp. NHM501043]